MKRQIAAILTATVMPLAACTATSGADPTASSDPVSSTVTTSSPTTTTSTEPVDSGQSGTETMSAPPMNTPSASTVATSESTAPTGDAYDAIPVEIPASTMGADRDAAEKGIAVWRNAVRVLDQSLQDPAGKDWKPIIYRYINDPAALKQVALINTFVKQKIHQVGDTDYSAKVLDVSEHNVQVRACVNLGRYDVVDDVGVSVLKPGQPDVFARVFSVSFYYDNDPPAWFVNNITTPEPAEPC